MPIGFRRNRALAATVVGLALVAAACGGGDDNDAGTAPPAASDAPSTADAAAGNTAETGEPVTLRLGYFPNVTHAPAIIGVEDGLFQDALGPNVTLDLSTFNSGTEVIEAMFSDAIDASFIGPNPAINGYAKSDGEALRIVAGTTSGGAFLVVARRHRRPRPARRADAGHAVARQHPGRRAAGVARRTRASRPTPVAAATCSIVPQENADTLTTFQSGDIDGAWVPEPWATRLIDEGGGHVLVDEARPVARRASSSPPT